MRMYVYIYMCMYVHVHMCTRMCASFCIICIINFPALYSMKLKIRYMEQMHSMVVLCNIVTSLSRSLWGFILLIQPWQWKTFILLWWIATSEREQECVYFITTFFQKTKKKKQQKKKNSCNYHIWRHIITVYYRTTLGISLGNLQCLSKH